MSRLPIHASDMLGPDARLYARLNDLEARLAALERRPSHVLTLSLAVEAADVPNNSIFRDSADGIIKIKDSTGTLRLLY